MRPDFVNLCLHKIGKSYCHLSELRPLKWFSSVPRRENFNSNLKALKRGTQIFLRQVPSAVDNMKIEDVIWNILRI